MFHNRDKRLQDLNDELLAEEEEWLEEEEVDYEAEFDEDLLTEEFDFEENEEVDFCEEDELEEPAYRNYSNRYSRGSPKVFDFDEYEYEDDLEDEDFLYRDDYKKAKKKKKRGNLGLKILAFLELMAIAAIAIWWLSWIW